MVQNWALAEENIAKGTDELNMSKDVSSEWLGYALDIQPATKKM